MTISKVAAMFSLTPDTLRWYEKIGLIKPVHKVGKVRDYSQEDLNRIEFVACMRKAGLSIEFLQRYMNLLDQGDSTVEERKKILLEQREILLEKKKQLETTLARLDFKIKNYTAKICDKKEGCK